MGLGGGASETCVPVGLRANARSAVAEGMRTMYQDGLLKCLRGVTSVEEVLRVTQEA